MGKLNQTIIDHIHPYGHFDKRDDEIHNMWAKNHYEQYTPRSLLPGYIGITNKKGINTNEQHALHGLEQARAILFELKQYPGEYTGECQQAALSIENAINHLTHRIVRRNLLGKGVYSLENNEEQLRIIANSGLCDLCVVVGDGEVYYDNVYPQVIIPKCMAAIHYLKQHYLSSYAVIDLSLQVIDENCLRVHYCIVDSTNGNELRFPDEISISNVLNHVDEVENTTIQQYIDTKRDDIQITLTNRYNEVQHHIVDLPESVKQGLTGGYKRTVLFKLIRVISEYFEKQENIMLFGNPKCDSILFGFGEVDNISKLRKYIDERAEFIAPFAGAQ